MTTIAPTPWRLRAGNTIVDADNYWLFDVKIRHAMKKEEEEIAQRIVTAVNCHDALVAALKAVTVSLENWVEVADESELRDYDDEALQMAYKALAAASGETS